MIKSIVLAIDGSVHAQRAQAMAIDLASRYDAQLTLVHVLTHDHPSSEFERMAKVEHLADSATSGLADKGNTYSAVARFLGTTSGSRDDEESRIIVLLAEQIIDKASKSAHEAGVKNVTTEILSGDYANCILEAANKVDADVIIMGRRGLSDLKGIVTGSVSHKVSERAECSVLTVK